MESPLCSPLDQGFHKALQVLAGLGEVIFSEALAADAPLHQAGLLQLAQALGEKRPGNAGQAPSHLIEVPGAEEHIPDDKDRPTVAEHLGGSGYGTVLSVGLHGVRILARAFRASPLFGLAAARPGCYALRNSGEGGSDDAGTVE